MEEVFISIMERIAQEMPELSAVDEDYYPVTFLCVLIWNVDSDWHSLEYGALNSSSLITVRLRGRLLPQHKACGWNLQGCSRQDATGPQGVPRPSVFRVRTQVFRTYKGEEAQLRAAALHKSL